MIPLTQGYETLVDTTVFELLLLGKNFHAVRVADGNYVYAATKGTGSRYLHRLITNAPKGFDVDHENDDKLDNRLSNLRVVSHQQNLANQQLSKASTSCFKGVTRNHKRWMAQTKLNGQRVYLGNYTNPEEAAKAYDAFMLDKFGEFAMTNERLGLLDGDSE